MPPRRTILGKLARYVLLALFLLSLTCWLTSCVERSTLTFAFDDDPYHPTPGQPLHASRLAIEASSGWLNFRTESITTRIVAVITDAQLGTQILPHVFFAGGGLTNPLGPTRRYPNNPFLTIETHDFFVPYAALSGMAALPLAILAWRSRQRGLRAGDPTTCAHCGYDLRHSPERCPECGHARPAVPTPH